MVNQVITTAVLSNEVVQQIVSRTDGVPLFIEELTKSVAESVGAQGRASLPSSAIPATLHDSLMARLDRLGTAKAVAQVGATLGREFNYEVLQAISPLDAITLQQALQQLVDAELLYQRGLPPQATYVFKHALIQDTAYQSLLKSTRQQYHQEIALQLEEQFPDTKETQPEILAHHYTEAGLIGQAIPYWQQAGNRANQRSAYVEAISHFTRELGLLNTLPNTAERTQQELTLQLAFSNSLMATRGYAAPEVEKGYARALELCRQMGEPSQLFSVLVGLWRFYLTRAQHKTALELGEQCLRLAQHANNPVRLLGAQQAIGIAKFYLGEFPEARAHLEQAMSLYNPQKRYFHASRSGQDPGVACLSHLVWTLWAQGYPDQAQETSNQAITLSKELSHPLSLTQALVATLRLYQQTRETEKVFEQAELLRSLSTEHELAFPLAWATVMRGWAVAEHGRRSEGIAQMRQGLTAHRATGAEANRPYYLVCLAEKHGQNGQPVEGLNVLTEAIAQIDETEEREYEAELYRLKGELTLQQESKEQRAGSREQGAKIETGPRPLAPDPQGEAEACFLKAIEIAQKQQAKSLELRASTSLARLWRQQGKRTEAHKLLSEIYNWFTEGFDTKDLQEAKALIEELSH